MHASKFLGGEAGRTAWPPAGPDARAGRRAPPVETEAIVDAAEAAGLGMAVLVRLGQGPLTAFMSARGAELLGYQPRDLEGRPASRFVAPEDRGALEAEAFPERTGARREVLGLRSDGTTIPLEVGIGQLRRGEAPGVVWIFRDATERHLAEKQRRRAYEHLGELERLQEADAFRVRVRELAHGLTTPMTPLIVAVDRLRADRAARTPEARAALEALEGSVGRVGALVRELLSLGAGGAPREAGKPDFWLPRGRPPRRPGGGAQPVSVPMPHSSSLAWPAVA